ncbi:MAG: DEDD exonuclease domain-containing protein, partial [Candidatus Kapabacteria bacterium]|nr:DEDD exonuclease domain-containing protein [Candidatus Kapabacteria bacterium]
TDVETTGSSGEHNRITEVACVVMRGGEVQHTFTSLINPRQFIPPFIEQLTGISNAMVYNAPEERVVMEEVAKLLRLPDAVFVAHNEQFDWSFVFHALHRSGIAMPNVERLCTCKLARRLLPKQRKKNLGSVASYYGIGIDARHRAYGDADATARVLGEMLDTLSNDHDVESLDDLLLFQNKRLKQFHATPRTLKRVQPTLDALPEEPGVYYMLDADERLMYIGKAKSLADRVRSYFQMSAVHPPKIADMVRKVHSILWEETGTELAALLQESREIKEHKPPYNTMSKKLRRYPFLKLTNEAFPRLDLCFAIEDDGAEYYGPFPGRGMVEGILDTIKKNFKLRLCSEIGEPSESVQPCFYFHVKQCNAPCAALQSQSDYARETDMVRKFLSGYSHGIIAMLEHEMTDCAERLEFENAAMLRNRIRELRKLFDRSEEVSSAVHKTNVVIILPASEREKTVEVFCIRAGLLQHQQIIGRKASLTKLFAHIRTAYFSEQHGAQMPLSPLQVDELRILTQWMYRRRNAGTYIYVDTMEWDDVCAAVENAVRTVFVPAESPRLDEAGITDNVSEYAE